MYVLYPAAEAFAGMARLALHTPMYRRSGNWWPAAPQARLSKSSTSESRPGELMSPVTVVQAIVSGLGWAHLFLAPAPLMPPPLASGCSCSCYDFGLPIGTCTRHGPSNLQGIQSGGVEGSASNGSRVGDETEVAWLLLYRPTSLFLAPLRPGPVTDHIYHSLLFTPCKTHPGSPTFCRTSPTIHCTVSFLFLSVARSTFDSQQRLSFHLVHNSYHLGTTTSLTNTAPSLRLPTDILLHRVDCSSMFS